MAKLKGQLFARLALDYFDHPKIMALSAEAIVAHLEMIVYSRKYGTDGQIPKRFASRFEDSALDELASNDSDKPSISRNGDGTITIHGYADMQETSDQIKERQQQRREAGRKGGLAKMATAKANAKQPLQQTLKQTSSKGLSENVAETETETETETDINTSSGFADAHPEAAQALDYFNDRVKQNGFKRPADTKANRDAARLLFTRDEYPPPVIREVMDWALSNEFWRTNIRSFSKFRDKFETMQAQMRRPQQSQSGVTFDQQRIQNSNQLFEHINRQIGGDIWTQDSSPKQIGQ